MKTFKHYGINVTHQIVETEFYQTLLKNNIPYTEPACSPDLNLYVYSIDGVTKYAVVKPLNIPDDYAEAVYITTSIPVDLDFNRLVQDVESQNDGALPMHPKTKLKLVLDTILSQIDNDAKPFAAKADLLSDEEIISQTVIALADYGYNKHKLIHSAHDDINTDFYSKLVEAM